MLEDAQVQVQGMIANRYMATFREEILKWQGYLNIVADVNQILAEVQRTWAYLESLFIHSEEVKKELPEATVRFARIDKEVKQVGGRWLGGVAALLWFQGLGAWVLGSCPGRRCALSALTRGGRGGERRRRGRREGGG